MSVRADIDIILIFLSTTQSSKMYRFVLGKKISISPIMGWLNRFRLPRFLLSEKEDFAKEGDLL